MEINDKIAYNTSRNYVNLVFDTVAKVTKTQMTTTKGLKFSLRSMREIKSKVSGSHLTASLWSFEQAEKHLKQIEESKERRRLVGGLEKALNACRSGNGCYHFEDEAKALMASLTTVLNK